MDVSCQILAPEDWTIVSGIAGLPHNSENDRKESDARVAPNAVRKTNAQMSGR